MTPEAQQNFAFAFLSMLLEGAPFIVLGTLLSGVIAVYLPAKSLERWLPRQALPAILMAALFGAVMPVCECAVVPVIRRLVRKGLPVSAAFAYMLAAPIVNPITALSTWKAFTGPEFMIGSQVLSASWVMTVSRLLLGYLMAVVLALLVDRLPLKKILSARLLQQMEVDERRREHATHTQAAASSHRLIAALRAALKDFIDVGAYFIMGIAITALFNTGIAPGAQWLDSLATHAWASPLVLMAFAYGLSLCSTSDAFIAASLDRFSYGAKLAFLVFGPMLDLKLTFMYQSLLRRSALLVMALLMLVLIGIAAMVFQGMVQPLHY